MKFKKLLAVSLIISLLSVFFAETSLAALKKDPKEKIIVTSSAFKKNGMIPDQYTYENAYCGWGESIPLDWQVDEETAKDIQSYAITMIDKNPRARNYVHLMVANIPADTRSVTEGALSGNSDSDPPGTYYFLNSSNRPGYDGPNPPRGKRAHVYEITVYGLNTPTIGLSPLDNIKLKDFKKTLAGKVVAFGRLRGKYKMRKRIVIDSCGDFNR